MEEYKKEFNFVVVFSWNCTRDTPFRMCVRALFSDGNEEEYLTRSLDKRSRLAKLKFKGIPGQEVSLFCKIDAEINLQMRKKFIDHLNSVYVNELENKTQRETYFNMLVKFPYRILYEDLRMVVEM